MQGNRDKKHHNFWSDWLIFDPRFTTVSEALFRRCSVEEVFLVISQNSQENTNARVSFLIKLQAIGFVYNI